MANRNDDDVAAPATAAPTAAATTTMTPAELAKTEHICRATLVMVAALETAREPEFGDLAEHFDYRSFLSVQPPIKLDRICFFAMRKFISHRQYLRADEFARYSTDRPGLWLRAIQHHLASPEYDEGIVMCLIRVCRLDEMTAHPFFPEVFDALIKRIPRLRVRPNRKTAAHLMAEAAEDAEIAAQLAGHLTVEDTQRAAKIAAQVAAQCVEQDAAQVAAQDAAQVATPVAAQVAKKGAQVATPGAKKGTSVAKKGTPAAKKETKKEAPEAE